MDELKLCFEYALRTMKNIGMIETHDLNGMDRILQVRLTQECTAVHFLDNGQSVTHPHVAIFIHLNFSRFLS